MGSNPTGGPVLLLMKEQDARFLGGVVVIGLLDFHSIHAQLCDVGIPRSYLKIVGSNPTGGRARCFNSNAFEQERQQGSTATRLAAPCSSPLRRQEAFDAGHSL